MSILIKGMEMPKEGCKYCPFVVRGINDWCLFLKKIVTDDVEYGKHPTNCPLIELPPHGRLIDADAIFEQWYQLNFDRKISDGTLAYWNVLLGEAPTVIEAEED